MFHPFMAHKKKALRAAKMALVALGLWVGGALWGAAVWALPERLIFQNLFENKDFTIEESTALFQDSNGFMWLGGLGSLLRYDGYDFRPFTLQPTTSGTPLAVDKVNCFFEDAQQQLWIGTNKGLLQYNPRTEQLRQIASPLNSLSILAIIAQGPQDLLLASSQGLVVFNRVTQHYRVIEAHPGQAAGLQGSRINAIYAAGEGIYWLGTSAGIERLDWNSQSFTLFKPAPEVPDSLLDNRVNDLKPDGQGGFWVGTPTALVHFNPATGQRSRYTHNPNNPYSIGSNDVWQILVDSTGTLWLATDGGGLVMFDEARQRFINHKHQPGRAGSIRSNVVRQVYEDQNGDIWTAHFPDGFNVFDRSSAAFISYQQDLSNPESLSHNAVTAMTETPDGQLWVGTDGGGLDFFDRNSQSFHHFKNNPNDAASLNGNSVISLKLDRQGRLWTGTWGSGLAFYNPSSRQFTRLPFDKLRTFTTRVATSNRLNNAHVWTTLEDKQGRLWIGTAEGGLSRYQADTQSFTHYTAQAQDPLALSNNLVWTLLEDHKGQLWVGTDNGLNRLENAEQGHFSHFLANPNNPTQLQNGAIHALYEDSQNRLWVGSRAGLSLFNATTNTFTTFGKKDGFTNESIRGIAEDSSGLLWITTENGFASFNPETHAIKNVTRIGGKLVGSLSNNTVLRSQYGEILVGGTQGLRIITPSAITLNLRPPPVVLTELALFSTPVIPGDDTQVLSSSIQYTPNITLNHTQTLFTLHFAALNFREPDKNSYSYKLEGFDKDWVQAGNQRSAKYTNLDAGTYTFKIKARNNDGVQSLQEKTLTLKVLPAPWKTPFAYAAYSLGACAMVLLWVHRQKRALAEAQKKIAMEQAVNEKLRSLEQLKENFLANTSHELRTPLNGIIGLAHSLSLRQQEFSGDSLNLINMILDSGKRLDHIVNDVLEFSRIAKKNLPLHCSLFPLAPLLNRVLSQLQARIHDKQLIVNNSLPAQQNLYGDPHRLEQILYRLLDNAVKFTQKGAISLHFSQADHQDIIHISDTGCGIAPQYLDCIFNAFEQAEGAAHRSAEGAGLGLAVAQQLARLHHGHITVKSTLGAGSEFSLHLPQAPAPAAMAAPPQQGPAFSLENALLLSHLQQHPPAQPIIPSQFRVLVVDDDPINRMVVKALLTKQGYQVQEANSGPNALQQLERNPPADAVVLDVMMPDMTGYEVCQTLRQHHSLHDLPILFLTANHQTEEIQKAFIAGGNAFLTKPIRNNALLTQLELQLHLLQQHRCLQLHFSALLQQAPAPSGTPPASPQLPATQALQYLLAQLQGLMPPSAQVAGWVLTPSNHFQRLTPGPSPQAPIPISKITQRLEHSPHLQEALAQAAQAGAFGDEFKQPHPPYCQPLMLNGLLAGFILHTGPMATTTTDLIAAFAQHMTAALLTHHKFHSLPHKESPHDAV